jgi:NNP family nitrate/nitrite transporter-like MFS transporter
LTKGERSEQVWVQSALLWYVPLLLVVGVAALVMLRRIPVKASFREQLDIFRSKHTLFCTITYVMTFGSFSGLAAAFPLLIKTVYGPDKFGAAAPDPLAYAFLGPLIGSALRVAVGFPSDRLGGSIITHVAGIGLLVGSLLLVLGGYLTPTSLDQFPVFVGLMLFLFFCSGAGNASTFRQFPIIFARSPRQAAGVIGFTAAIAAYGPFVFSALIGVSLSSTGSANAFFVGAAGYFAFAIAINWWYYTRKGAERYDLGRRGTWWDEERKKGAAP